MKKSRITLFTITILLFGGCSLSPKLQDSNLTLPQNISIPEDKDSTKIGSQWWTNYNDETLNSLIEEGLKNNRDLQTAMLNIEYARASMDIQGSQRYPSLNAKAGATRGQTSKNSKGASVTFNDFSLSAILSYEVDLWGKISSSNKAARANLLSTTANAHAIRLSLTSSIADSYFALVSLREQLKIAEETINSREETLRITKLLYDEGETRESVYTQQQSLLFQANIMKNNIEQKIALTSTALGILIGKDPASLLVDKDILTSKLPDDIELPNYIPSSIIENRPDIEASYQKLVSANELIGVSRASYFPSISLTALLGLQSSDINNLISSSAKTWNIGGSLVAPLIDFGRTRSAVEMAEITKNIAVINYEKSVVNAFGEVYNALNTRRLLKHNLQNSYNFEKSLERTLALSTQLYDSGYTDYLSILDAKRSLLNAKLATIQTKQAVLSSGVSLFKALGGGWDKKTYQDKK